MALLKIAEHSPEWHAIRLRNIGGSEIAGLFGVQADYQQSAYTLHMVKTGRIPAPPVDDAPGSRIWFGTRLEPLIAQMGAELHGWEIEKGGYCLDDTTPGMACSQDFIIKQPGPEEIKLGFRGPGNLQIKNIDWFQHKQKWDAGEPPFPILLQNQHEIACSGFSWGVILGMVGGNELPAYRYAAREKIITTIRDKVTAFWERVADGKPPSIDGTDSTAAALAALFPVRDDERVLDLSPDNELPMICAGLIVAKADRMQAAKIETDWENQLRAKLAGHKRAICNGYAINGVYTPANKGTRAGDMPPDKIIGARKDSIWFKIKELIDA